MIQQGASKLQVACEIGKHCSFFRSDTQTIRHHRPLEARIFLSTYLPLLHAILSPLPTTQTTLSPLLVMAIIEELGLGATVLINNEPAPEYPDTEPSVSESLGPDTKKSHCYVECVEGAEFAVRFEVKAPRNDIKQWLTGKDNGILFWVDIDGGRVEARPNVVCGETSHTLTGVKDRAKGLLHKFRFTSFSTGMSKAHRCAIERPRLMLTTTSGRFFKGPCCQGHRNDQEPG